MDNGFTSGLELPIEECAPTVKDIFGNMEEAISPSAWKQVFSYAYSLVGSRAEAEDIAQDTFVVLFRETRSGRPIEHFSAWMKTVARRLAYRRFHELRPDLHVSLDALNETGSRSIFTPIDPAPSAEKKVIDDDLLRLGEEILLQFSEKDRECIMMYFRGYDFLQIATMLGVSRWTARRTTLRVLQRFQMRVR